MLPMSIISEMNLNASQLRNRYGCVVVGQIKISIMFIIYIMYDYDGCCNEYVIQCLRIIGIM